MRFCAEQRLRRQSDFGHLRTRGRSCDCGAFTLWSAPRATPPDPFPKTWTPVPPRARVGVVASKAAVGNAVERARAKRRMRELFRKHQTLVPLEHDLLIVARGAINRLEYAEIERKFVEACRKAFPATAAPRSDD